MISRQPIMHERKRRIVGTPQLDRPMQIQKQAGRFP
jgi:hypothetical protein